ncbi:MAG: NADP-dependent malic enzyme [Bryobacterales bacterium]|nr:NADP-dependent malic enzyme [Bryobacterales bacterium]
MKIRREDALDYHAPTASGAPAGKVSVVSTKPCRTQRDLSLAYTPGVAIPCLEIEKDPSLAYQYTSKGNLVAVVTNGTAVLGLGNIGPLASKPVMEGKGVLFKRFADIDVFDIELAAKDPQEIIQACRLLEPTFGGINLEDIKAPDCFVVEEELRRTLKIPVFHDDQHGTAIISGAALLNALEIAGKKLDEVEIVVNGAGASAISCARHFVKLGARRERITMCDSKGVLHAGRMAELNPYKQQFVRETAARTLSQALAGADVFIGLSSANCVTGEMLKPMARNPVIFALANPDPEIPYEEAVAARPDAIVATGRSDYPNQVNNVLGFPFIFRGALDVRATTINDEMKLAATRALAALARADVPDSVRRAYGVDKLEFGREYIIPKPFDPRVLVHEAAAVAGAAMASGVAQVTLDLSEYRESLEKRLGKAREVMRMLIHKAQQAPKRVVFPEGADERIVRAARVLVDERIARPVLVGAAAAIRSSLAAMHVDAAQVEIVDPASDERAGAYGEELFRLRQRKGITRDGARLAVRDPFVFASMMVRMGDADGMLGGMTRNYPDTIRPALQVIRMEKGLRRVCGAYLLITPKGEFYLLADPTVNIEPSSEDLAEIAILTARTARRFDLEPRVAMVSFSNFGSTRHPLAEKVARAVELVRERAPELVVDGEVQADLAVSPELLAEQYPFSPLAARRANVLVFPNLEAGNAAYRLLARLGNCELVGPVLMGFAHPVHVLPPETEVDTIVKMAAVAVVEAQENAAR